jgi:hypothetical protein
MKKISFNQMAPYLAAIVIFISILFIYFNPLLEGKKIKQHDIAQWKGMSKEISDFREKTGEEPLWTNSMFGGMPAYQISVQYKANLVRYIDDVFKLGLPHPAGLVFLYFIGFLILMLFLGIDPWLSIAGAIAFAFSSYFFIILEAGHNSKAHAIGYMAPVLAAIILTYRGKFLLGGILAALFLSLELYTNHPQITYYLGLIIVAYGISEFIFHLQEKKLKSFFISSLVIVAAVMIALGTSATSLWATYEYGKETIRGKTELTTQKENRTTGLDKEYATGWSYGVGETMTLLIPNYKGGASMGSVGTKSETYKALVQNNVPQESINQVINNLPLYWGDQPSTSGPVYVGAILIFLFILGLFVVENRYRWWLLAITLLSIMLSWGHNFMPLTDFFFKYVPGYNKFRSVSMTLVIAELTIPLLGLLALRKVFETGIDKKKLLRQLAYATGITAGITLILALIGGSLFSFSSPQDAQYKDYFPDWVMSAIRLDRASMLSSDAWRSFIFIVLSASIIWAYLSNKLKKYPVFALLAVLILIDLWTVNKRFVNDDDFVRKSLVNVPFQPSQADELIMKDTDPDYRVMNFTVSPFNDASTSYFHKSIGGYHGAKLRRYQELIEHHLSKNNMNVYNMLNTKYFIVPGQDKQPTVQINMKALGSAWFVNHIKWVNNADEEINSLTNFNPADTVVIDKRFEDKLNGHLIARDSTAVITLKEYKPNYLTYASTTGTEQLAVFSEIYYAKGWDAYIDGKPAPYFRANYVLRAMIVPAGKHEIEFKFDPPVYRNGEKISLASSILLILLLVGGGVSLILQKKKD